MPNRCPLDPAVQPCCKRIGVHRRTCAAVHDVAIHHGQRGYRAVCCCGWSSMPLTENSATQLAAEHYVGADTQVSDADQIAFQIDALRRVVAQLPDDATRGEVDLHLARAVLAVLNETVRTAMKA